MTVEELVEALKNIGSDYNGDPESFHQEADSLLLRFIDNPEVSEAYRRVPKWYA